jgi:hypothetical protein
MVAFSALAQALDKVVRRVLDREIYRHGSRLPPFRTLSSPFRNTKRALIGAGRGLPKGMVVELEAREEARQPTDAATRGVILTIAIDGSLRVD